MRLTLVLVWCAVLLAACGGGDDQGTQDAAATEPKVNGATATPTGLTEAAAFSALGVIGRDRFRACVEVLDESVAEEDAEAVIEEALMAATKDQRWHVEFQTPSVDIGCPLPPAMLASDAEPECRSEVSPYLAYVFVGGALLFEESFPEERLRQSFPVPGIRRYKQEYLSVDARPCAVQVAEGWYLTPDDLKDGALLQQYIFGIYPIAEVCC